jgi:hypothetical protein
VLDDGLLRGTAEVFRQATRGNHLGWFEGNGALDDILQLAYVARP